MRLRNWFTGKAISNVKEISFSVVSDPATWTSASYASVPLADRQKKKRIKAKRSKSRRSKDEE